MSKLLTSTLRLTLRLMRNDRRVAAARLRGESGQSLIEMALVLPMFFTLMIGLINFCMVMFGLCNVSYASRHAARYACLHSGTSLVPVTQTTVDAMVAPYVFRYPSNSYTDKLSYGTAGNVVGGTATVKVTISYNMVIVFFTLAPINLAATASGTIVQ